MPQPRRDEIRRRFAAALARLNESEVLSRDCADPDEYPRFRWPRLPQQRLAAAWFSLQIACPFLEDESCGIYQDRPLVCRELPGDQLGRRLLAVVPRAGAIGSSKPVRLGAALARTAAQVAGVSTSTIPLLLSLDLSPEVDKALAQPRDPCIMLETLLGEIGEWRIEPAP
jgi:hypothetical protein